MKFSNFQKYLEFDNTDHDPCNYYNEDRSVIIALFVDDGLIAGTDEDEMIEILKRLNRKLEITFNTAPSDRLSYLSMQIHACKFQMEFS